MIVAKYITGVSLEAWKVVDMIEKQLESNPTTAKFAGAHVSPTSQPLSLSLLRVSRSV